MVQGRLRAEPSQAARGEVVAFMPAPFHFSFIVSDLASTRRFYGEILGCREGRSTDTWVDFDFFGNQISAHTTGEVMATRNTGEVDGVAVPMPHFGAIPWRAVFADERRFCCVVFFWRRFPTRPRLT